MPTENRSSNTEMVSVPFQREDRYIVIKRSDLKKVPVNYRSALVDPMLSLLSHLPHRECLVIESDWPEYEPAWAAIEQRVTGKQAEQHQGEPVAVPERKPWSGLLATADNLRGEGWNACLEEIAKLGPLYTHADPGEVERLREENRVLQKQLGERWTDIDALNKSNEEYSAAAVDSGMQNDTLRARLAEAQAQLGAIAGWTEETRAAVLEAFQDELNESASYEWYDSAIADLMKLVEALSASAQPSAPRVSIPDRYCLMPRSLTAENGAKALLLGEFRLEVTRECPECLELDEPLKGCEICDGEGEYAQRYTIPWEQIRFIYSEAVKGLALKPDTAR